MSIEEFFEHSSDEKIQEFIKTVDMESFCKIIDEYPPFVKQRVVENVTDRVRVWIEEKTLQAKTNPLESSKKEELIKEFEKAIL